ncbi:MAG: deoxyribose-phosphate aldolase [Terriglobales bacterium]
MSAVQPISDWRALARTIDHTLIRTDGTREAVVKLCDEALHYGFHTVSVQPCQIALVASMLRGSQVLTGSVVGFPQGATLTTVKQFEAAEVMRLGAQELDMVLNIAALKSGDHDSVANDIKAVAHVAHDGGAILKVIIETPLLTREEKVLACELCLKGGADYVKTATGMAGGGAAVEDVRLMRSVVGKRAGVKAAGGIRTAADAAAMLAAGADRLGTSASVAIMHELGAPGM